MVIQTFHKKCNRHAPQVSPAKNVTICSQCQKRMLSWKNVFFTRTNRDILWEFVRRTWKDADAADVENRGRSGLTELLHTKCTRSDMNKKLHEKQGNESVTQTFPAQCTCRAGTGISAPKGRKKIARGACGAHVQRFTLHARRAGPVCPAAPPVSTFHVGEMRFCKFVIALAPQAYFFCCSRKSMQKEELGTRLYGAHTRAIGERHGAFSAANLIALRLLSALAEPTTRRRQNTAGITIVLYSRNTGRMFVSALHKASTVYGGGGICEANDGRGFATAPPQSALRPPAPP